MTIAVLTFSVTYILLMLEKIPRYIVSLIGASVIIISGVLTMEDAVHFVSWETIGLLLGMFIIISVLEHGNFFNYLAVRVIQSVKFDIRKIYLIFPIITAVLSGFMDSITVMLFFTILTVNLCKLFELNPIPLVIAEVCTANIGGSATLVGDPPNVIIGSILGYDFNDFITNTAPIAIIATIAVTIVFFALNQKKLKVTRKLSEDEKISVIQNNQITNGRYVYIGIIAFSAAIFILLLHPIVNSMFGFHINASIATLVPALVCLFFLGAEEGEKVLKSIDSVTFLFFIGLFIVVGALEKTGAISVMSDYMLSLAGGKVLPLVLIFIWGCGIISAIVDNVPMALTMSYVVMNMISGNSELLPMKDNMVWALALGLDIGGNMTPIGASANVVAYRVLEKTGIKVGWIKWMKHAIPVTVLALAISTLGIYIKITL